MLLILNSCVNFPKIPPNPATPSPQSDALKSSSFVNPSMIDLFSRSDGVSVFGMKYRDNLKQLIVVYSDGHLRNYDLAKMKVLSDYQLGIVTASGLDFDRSGRYVTGATQHDSDQFNDEYIGGTGIWDMSSGELVKCSSKPCDIPGKPEEKLHATLSGNLIDPNGIFIVQILDGGVCYDHIFDDFSWLCQDFFATNDYKIIGKVAYDDAHKKLVVAFLDGTIELVNYSNGYVGNFGKILVEGRGKSNQVSVIWLGLSQDHKILARIYAGRLMVWDASRINSFFNWRPTLLMNVSASNAKNAFFDPSGKYIFVLTTNQMQVWNTTFITNQIQVWDIATGKTIAQFDTPGISAIASDLPDQIYWGDQKGGIHSIKFLTS